MLQIIKSLKMLYQFLYYYTNTFLAHQHYLIIYQYS